MGTQPQRVAAGSGSSVDLWIDPPPQQRLSDQERLEMINQIADRMARSFADAVIQTQQNRPTPLRNKVIIVVVIAAALLVVAGVPAYLAHILVMKALGLN